MRRSVLPLVVLATLSLAFAPAPLPRPDPSKQDLKKLQGAWEMTSASSGGRPAERTLVFQIVIAGDRITITQGMQSIGGLPITLAAKATLKGFDVKSPFGPNPRALRGVYALEGDTLTVSYSTDGKRPADLTGQAPTQTRIVFRRTAR